MRNVRITIAATTSPAIEVRNSRRPRSRCRPAPARTGRGRPCPAIGVTTSLPPIAARGRRRPRAARSSPRSPANTPMPPATPSGARDSGVASSISSRPLVSSEAQPATRVAAAKPARMNPNWTNDELQEAARARSGRWSGTTGLKISTRRGREFASSSPNERGGGAEHEARTGRSRCPTRAASGSRSPNERLVGPRRPSVACGHAGPRDAARRRRGRGARTPRRRPRTGRSRRAAPSSSDGQSYWPASGWWCTVQPNQVRLARPRERRHRRLVAVDEVAADAGRRRRSRPRRRDRGTAPARTRPSPRRAPRGRPTARTRSRAPAGSRRREASRTRRRPATSRAPGRSPR